MIALVIVAAGGFMVMVSAGGARLERAARAQREGVDK